MKNLYTLDDLLRMLKGQSEKDFQGIKVLLEILEDKSISKNRKFWLIIAGLRGLNLYEIDLENQQEDDEERSVPEITFEKTEALIPYEIIDVEILNAIVGFKFILN